MSAFLQGIAAAGLLALIAVILPLLPWPDISIYLEFFGTVIGYFFFFNLVFPVDTLFTIAVLIITIEFSLWVFRMALNIMNFFIGQRFKDK